MSSLNINNQTTVTNIGGSSISVVPVANPAIGVVTVAGPQGIRGPRGIDGTGSGGGAAGVTSLNGLTGILDIAGGGSINVTLSGQSILVSGSNSQAQIDAFSGYSNIFLVHKTGDESISGSKTFAVGNTDALTVANGAIETFHADQFGITAHNGANTLVLDGVFQTLNSDDGSQSVHWTHRQLVTNNNPVLDRSQLTLSGEWGTNATGVLPSTVVAYSRLTDTSGALNTAINATGNQAWQAANANAINLSGNLTNTGSNLYRTVTGMSGALVTMIGGSTAGVASVNGLTGIVNISGIGTASVNIVGQSVIISGSGLNQVIAAPYNTVVNALTLINPIQAVNTGISFSPFIEQDGYTWSNAGTGSSNPIQFRFGVKPYIGGIGSWILESNTNNNGWMTGIEVRNNLNGIVTPYVETAEVFANLVVGASTIRSLGNSYAFQQDGTGINQLYIKGVIPTGVSDSYLYLSIPQGAPVLTILGDTIISGSGFAYQTDLTATGASLYARDLAISGALQALIAGGGSVVKITGSSAIPTANFTGIGGLLVFSSGNQIFISGNQPGAGGGVPSVNGITSAVTIQGTGGLNVTSQGSIVSISGFNGVSNKQVLFNTGGNVTGDLGLTYDPGQRTLSVGPAIAFVLPTNPLAIAGSGNTYYQTNIQNRSAGTSAQSDYVLTADIGTDTTFFVDLGINNTLFADTGYNLYKPLDGFLYNRGGDMFLGTAVPGNKVGIHAGGIASGNLTATITSGAVGILTASPSQALDVSGNIGMTGILVTDTLALDGVKVANRPMWAVIESGIVRSQMMVGPAMWSRQFTAILPQTTTTQVQIGNTVANVGTVSTVASEVLGQYSNIASAATVFTAAGTSATTPYFFRGSMSGRNGFFFTSTFALADGSNTTGAYGALSGSRIFVGMTDQTTSATVLTNNPAGNRVGLSYVAATGGTQPDRFDLNWQISSKDNTTEFTGVTPMNFQTGFYRFSMYAPPFAINNTGVFWQLDDLIRGSGTAGVITGNLPIGSTALRPSSYVCAVSGGARNLRSMNLYTENVGCGG